MNEQIKALQAEIDTYIISNESELESFRNQFVGRKSQLASLFDELKNVPAENRREVGQALNGLKNSAETKFAEAQEAFAGNAANFEVPSDLTLYNPISQGSLHPLTKVRARILEIFNRMGFSVSDGPEIETDFYNFTALNFPANHPAREMQDTFFIQTNPDVLLRTHTSSVQVRYMENNKPPIRTISPGRVFRNEAVSSRSHCIFHQVEGLYIDKEVSFADLKQTLLYFTKEMFGKSKIRLRPSYFPFTEPSAEIDIYWGLKTETDYRITKGTGWLEIMGCGMVDPNVLKNCGINPDEYNGFAFGMGIERIAMLLYQIGDIRMFYENDVRFLEQFKSSI